MPIDNWVRLLVVHPLTHGPVLECVPIGHTKQRDGSRDALLAADRPQYTVDVSDSVLWCSTRRRRSVSKNLSSTALAISRAAVPNIIRTSMQSVFLSRQCLEAIDCTSRLMRGNNDWAMDWPCVCSCSPVPVLAEELSAIIALRSSNVNKDAMLPAPLSPEACFPSCRRSLAPIKLVDRWYASEIAVVSPCVRDIRCRMVAALLTGSVGLMPTFALTYAAVLSPFKEASPVFRNHSPR